MIRTTYERNNYVIAIADTAQIYDENIAESALREIIDTLRDIAIRGLPEDWRRDDGYRD